MYIDPRLKEFLEKNIDLIDSNHFYELYRHKDFPIGVSRGHFMDVLYMGGLDPLQYLDNIPQQCFNNSTMIAQITLPDHIENINMGAFACTALQQIIINDNCKSIDQAAFMYSDGLEEIHINKTTSKLKIIGPDCFRGCISIKSIILPDSLEHLGSNAFGLTPNLEMCSIGKNTQMESEVFYNSSLTSLWYRGYMHEYRELPKSHECLYSSSIKRIICDDGVITI